MTLSALLGSRRAVKRFAAVFASIALFGLVLVLAGERSPVRDKYVLINETGMHDFDLALKMSLKLAEKKSGVENALILLPELPPAKTIEETAADLFSKLRIGARRDGRGILYLYSAKENLLKIEVSYALEGDIPDSFCRRLEDAAKTYMLSELPQDFISELIITTNLRAMESQAPSGSPGSLASQRRLAPMTRPEWIDAEFLSGGGGALVHGYRRTLEEYQAAIRGLPRNRLEQFAPSKDAPTTAARYLRSLAEGIGDPRLPLLTEGSAIFRAVVPRDEAQLRRIFEFLQAAEPHRLLFARDLALLVPQPGKSNLPVVLRQGTDGLWYVDEPKAWTYFHRFEDDVNFRVKYADNPFLAQLRALGIPNMDPIYGDHLGTPARSAYPFKLTDAVGALEARTRAAPADAAGYAALADLYMFELNWITKAIAALEKAQALAPDELSYRWRLVDLYLNDSRADKSLAELKYLADHLPNDGQTRQWYELYKKAYQFSD